MFGKLKDKLKGALSIFSKKVEEVPQEEVEKVIAENPVEKEETFEEVKEEAIEEVKETAEAEEQEKEDEETEEKEVEVKKEEAVEEAKEEISEEKEEKKPAVLIFHGWEDNAESGFIPAVKEFLIEHGHDARSFNQPNTKKPNFSEWYEFAEEKINSFKDQKLSLIGHSMGGLLSLKLAENHKIDRLILIAPVGSKPAGEYFQSISDKLNAEELEIFRAYQQQDLDVKKIKKNVKEIAFIFGMKDPWIKDEIRKFYLEKFKDKAEIHLLGNYAHMSESEGIKEIPIVEELFRRKLGTGIIEHDITKTAEDLVKETKDKFSIEEKSPDNLGEVKSPSVEDFVKQTKEKFAAETEKEKEFQASRKDVPSTEELVQKVQEEELKKKEKKVPFAEKIVDEADDKAEDDKEDVEDNLEVLKVEDETKELTPKNIEEIDDQKESEIVEEKKSGLFGKLKKSLGLGKEKTAPAEEAVVAEPEKEKEVKVGADEPELEEAKESRGFFSKVKEKLTTKTISESKFEDLFWDLELILLENNVSVEVIEKIKEDLKEELVDKPLPRDVLGKIEETLKNSLDEILTYDKIDLLQKAVEHQPLIIAFFGINGAGKTTSIAKLTNYFQKNNKSVVLAACDTFRAAAIQQLEEHANNLGVKIIKHDYGSDAAAVAYDAIKYAEKNKVDVVLIDTAGRLHSNTNLMAELEKIIRVTKPHLKIFVGESITGNDCIEQAQKFNDLVEMDGVILTKADVDEKGGAPLSISYTINKPILFLGVGQSYDDLEEFDKNVILKRLGF